MKLSVKSIRSLDAIPADAWNQLLNDSNPFLRHEYLAGLEQFKCLEQHGWQPFHIVVYGNNELVGAMPLYIKSNSYGEFVFDWAWAEAYEHAGEQYYPKLVSAIPFAPVTGPRLLINPDSADKSAIQRQIITYAIKLINDKGLSSLHCLFHDQDDYATFKQHKLLQRLACQYHWFNHNYRDFNAFLATLNSKKRKQINRERKSILATNIKIEVLQGVEISNEQWEVFYEFYCSTFYRKWGAPRLTLEFFQYLSKSLPEATLLFLAQQGGQYIAGAYAMRSEHTLYGRHWGCNQQLQNLHFELCYYQTIEYCIKHGLKTLDAGAQGEHKISRGFIPIPTWSAHWVAEPQFRMAIQKFLQQEQPYIEQYMSSLFEHSPYKQD